MKIPPVIKRGLQNYSLVNKSVSRLGGKNMQFKSPNGAVIFLKTGQGVATESLVREKIALEWLENKQIAVPKVLNYFEDKNDRTTYLLLSALEGSTAQRIVSLNREKILRIAAKALKKFHSISISGSNNLRTLDDDLDHIQTCIRLNLIKRRNFQMANEGKTPEDVYLYLFQMKDKLSNNVIVHGDYCLPNIMITQNSCGFLDVGDCGLGDPYKDFSAMEVSIVRNFGKEWIDSFYKYYDGMKKVDEFKIKYYQLIDQFGYHLDVEKYRKSFKILTHLKR